MLVTSFTQNNKQSVFKQMPVAHCSKNYAENCAPNAISNEASKGASKGASNGFFNRAPNFKGQIQAEILLNQKKHVYLIQETAFFRQNSALKFVKDYIVNNFSQVNPVKILDGACSTGEEAWSLAMLLKDLPNKIHIVGFDMGPNAIAKANSGIYKINKMSSDFNRNHLKMEAYKDFYLAFDNANSVEQLENKKLFNTFFQEQKKPISFMQKIMHLCDKKNISESFSKTFRINSKYKNNVEFEQCDIKNLDKLAADGEINVLLFRNAIYHLITNNVISKRRVLKENAGDILKNIFENIHKKLSKNGIFVIGSDESKQTMDFGLTQKILSQSNFEPIFKTKKYAPYCVWKKFR